LHLQFSTSGVEFVIQTRIAGQVAAMIPARLCGCSMAPVADCGDEVRVRR
jgi:hypothetical protein